MLFEDRFRGARLQPLGHLSAPGLHQWIHAFYQVLRTVESPQCTASLPFCFKPRMRLVTSFSIWITSGPTIWV